MRNSVFIPVFFFLIHIAVGGFSQVGINTDEPNNRAVLDLNSPTNDQGLLVPRLSTLQRTAQAFISRLTESENGLLVFDTNDKLFYYWMYPSWKAVEADVAGTIWRSGSEVPQNSIGEEGDFYLNVYDGSVYTKNAGEYLLTANIKGQPGPQGLKGDPGIQGEIGPQGPQGVKGDQGDAGPIGPQGLPGEKGDTGAIGPEGPQGLKGDPGIQGEIGPEGPQGLKGDQGDAGPIGPQGLPGEKGDTGAMGPEGPQGLKGDPGIQGEVGPEGPQGVKGDQGDIGPIGPQGPPGEQGETGAQGPEGPQGPQGEPGISTSFKAVSTTTNYTATGADDVIIALNGNTTITLPSAGSVPGKVFHIRHNLNILDLGTVTISAPSGNSIIDGSASQTFGIGGALGITAISIIAVDADKWYIIGKF